MGNGSAVYAILVELKQHVSLIRDGSLVRGATTWDTVIVGMVPTSNIQPIRFDIKDKVDKFINAYLSVNPKK